MRNVFTIAGKELRSYFTSPVAYVLLASYLALAGYFFYALLLAFHQTLQIYSMMRNPEMLSRFNLNQMVIAPLLHNLAVLLIFIVPAITMRMFPAPTSCCSPPRCASARSCSGSSWEVSSSSCSWSPSPGSSASCFAPTGTRSCR